MPVYTDIKKDPDYVLIKRWVPEYEQDFLWTDTLKLRERRAILSQDDAKGKQKQKTEVEYEFVRKTKKKKTPSPLLDFLAGRSKKSNESTDLEPETIRDSPQDDEMKDASGYGGGVPLESTQESIPEAEKHEENGRIRRVVPEAPVIKVFGSSGDEYPKNKDDEFLALMRRAEEDVYQEAMTMEGNREIADGDLSKEESRFSIPRLQYFYHSNLQQRWLYESPRSKLVLRN